MAKVKIKDFVEELLNPFLQENGMELYNVELVKEAKDWFLRVYIDMPEGKENEYISTDQCEMVSRFLSDKLDESDPIEQNYYLEVSSPGLDRVLFRDKDYKRFAGHLVDVSLYQSVEGRKNLTAELIGVENGVLKLKAERDNAMEIPMEKVAKIRLTVVF